MVMRIGGLASGMDIDELVKKLMTAERIPLDKLNQKKTIYEWQRDAYRDVNKKIKTFDTYIADNFILKNINSKTATSSNSNLVSAIATSKASGTLTIDGVSQLAEAGRITGGQVNAIGSTKMKDLASGTIEFKTVQADGTMAKETTKIEITDDMTVDDFVKKVNESDAGVSAVFENGRFSFTAKNTGKGSIEITGDTSGMKLTEDKGASIREGKNAIFQVNGIATERSTNTFSINGYNITLKSTFNGAQTIAERYNAAYTEWKNTTSDEYKQKIAAALTEKNTATGAYNTAKVEYDRIKNALFGDPSNVDKEIFDKIGNPQLVRSLTEEEVQKIAGKGFANEEAFETWLNDNSTDPDLKAKLKEANIDFDQFKAIGSLDYEKLQGLSAQSMYDTLGTSFLNGLTDTEKTLVKGLVPASEEEFNKKIADWKENGTDEEKALVEKLSGLNDNQKSTLRQLSDTDFDKMTNLASTQMDYNVKLAAKNAAENEHITLVNRQTKAETDFKDTYKQQFGKDYEPGNDPANPYDPGKVTNIPGNTESPVTLSSTTNVDDMMKSIKEFVATYNGFIKDLSDQTKESKYRDYAPLTAEQKKEMSENEIKLWEEKAKSGLLRGDSLIRNGLADMRSVVYETNPAVENSKFNSLFKIGITTSKNYNEGGTLEIDEGKLRKALEEDPDSVAKLFSFSDGKEKDTVYVKNDKGESVPTEADTRGFFQKVRGSMKEMEINIEKKAGRSTMTDNQYAIGKSLIDAEKRIKTWERKLETIEARYWKQFSAMESAINKANSQSSLFMQGQ